jgi:hypothetical protein
VSSRAGGLGMRAFHPCSAAYAIHRTARHSTGANTVRGLAYSSRICGEVPESYICLGNHCGARSRVFIVTSLACSVGNADFETLPHSRAGNALEPPKSAASLIDTRRYLSAK